VDSQKREVMIFFSLTAVALGLIGLFFGNAPAPTMASCDGISIQWIVTNGRDPAAIEKSMTCAQEYKQDHEKFLLIGFCLTYVTFQTFAIPGGICLLLNILAGAVFPFWLAELIVMFCATTGATCSFLVSNHVGRGVIEFYGLDRHLADYRQKVNQNRDRIFTFLVLTRCTPVPAVLINIASPLLDVPLVSFFFSTIVGQIPLNTVHMFAGYTMAKSGKFEPGNIKWIMIGGVIVTGYMFFGDTVKAKLKQMRQSPQSP